jgi:hypothetical protein
MVSEPCFDPAELRHTLERALDGSLPSPNDNGRKDLIEWHLAALSGPLACERIVGVIEEMQSNWKAKEPSLANRLQGKGLAAIRTVIKRYKDSRPGSHNRPEFQKHRYPEVSLDDLRGRIDRFQELLKAYETLEVEKVFDRFFRIGPKRSHL